jgi:hypothetical protein
MSLLHTVSIYSLVNLSQMTFKELGIFREAVNATKGTFDNTNLGTSAVGRYN